MGEKQTERKLTEAVTAAGGWAIKLLSTTNGMPDRLVMMPGGHIGFVEVKSPGQKPRKLQIRRHVRLRHLGFPVFVLDDPEQIPGIIKAVQKGGRGWEA